MRKWFEITGNRIMQILLENSGASWAELCKHLGVTNETHGAVHMNLYNHLWMLIDAGLIRIDDISRKDTIPTLDKMLSGEDQSSNKFRASGVWIKMQAALNAGVSWGNRSAQYTLSVNPLFGSPQDLPKQTDVFVLMPFAPEFTPLYIDHIVPAISGLGLTVSRADDFLTTNAIMSDVWTGICGCGVAVADCTGRNPNVFYELGVAHTVGKPVVIITRNDEDVPSDLKQMRYIKYEFTPRGMIEFEDKLQRTVYTALGMYEPIGSPPRFS